MKQRTYRGGKFIGKGGFGCTFGFPPLPCWNPRGGPAVRASSDKVTKLMYSPEAQQEITKNGLFRTIDPTQTYFISNDGTNASRCRPELAATDPSDQLDKCHLDQTKSLELVFFDYGGVNLDHVTLTAKEYAPFFKSLHKVLEGLRLAHANNIVHHDIKPGNIVTQQLPDGKFQTRLIDYDFAFDVRNPTPHDLSHLDRRYIFFPFEALFVNKAMDSYFFPKARMPAPYLVQLEFQLRQLIREWYLQFSMDYMKGFVLGDKQAFSGTRTQQIGYTEYTASYKPTLSVLRTNTAHYLKSVDVYMIGYTLGLLLNKFFSCIMFCEDKAARRFKIAFKVDTPQLKTYLFSNEFVAKGFSQEAENWFKTVEEWVLIPYADLVEEMTTWDLTKRITMDDAHLKYGRLLIVMGMYFTEDAITRFLVPLGAVKIKAQPVLPDVPSPTDLTKIQVSPAPEPANRPYNPPPTNLSKIQTNLFKGGRSRRRKTQKKRGRK